MNLTENKKKLLEATVSGLLGYLGNNKDLLHVRQSAFDTVLPETNETVQVQVTVTRDKTDFLDFLQTEEMS